MEATALINEALTPLELNRGLYDVLTALRRAGAPYALTPKELSKSLLLSGAGLTSRLHALEAKRLIARLPEPSDRRTVRIQLTSYGESVINEAIPMVFDVQRRCLDPLGEDGRERLIQELRKLAEALQTTEATPRNAIRDA